VVLHSLFGAQARTVSWDECGSDRCKRRLLRQDRPHLWTQVWRVVFPLQIGLFFSTDNTLSAAL
jgi:hypothetical protein